MEHDEPSPWLVRDCQRSQSRYPRNGRHIPLPTVLGGTCVTFNDVAIPLFQTTSGQITGQIPDTVKAGQNVVQVRSSEQRSRAIPCWLLCRRLNSGRALPAIDNAAH